MSEYDLVPRSGGLKLKKIDHTIKKKKKKRDDILAEKPSMTRGEEAEGRDRESLNSKDDADIDAAIEARRKERNPLANKTKAELRFIQMQEKIKEKRIMDKASKTHKMRVEDFNKHLDGLTEHFDIPKVSWTK